MQGGTIGIRMLGIVLLSAVLAGCEYGYSRSALMVESRYPAAPPPQGYVSYGYDAYWGFPGAWSFSYTFGAPYAPYYRPYVFPYFSYYYAPYYAYPPYVYGPYQAAPRPRRTIRLSPGSGSPKPGVQQSPPSSRRRLNLP